MILGKPRRFWLDMAERVAWTFVAAFAAAWLGPLLAGGVGSVRDLLDLAVLDKALVAGLAAVVTLVKSLAGGAIGNTGTASTLPQRADPATPPPVPPAGPDPLP